MDEDNFKQCPFCRQQIKAEAKKCRYCFARLEPHEVVGEPYVDYSQTGGMPLPPELKKWNWGAFFLNWIWGIGTESWSALWALVPYWSFVWSFVCGAKGNEWAWKAQEWSSIEEFNQVQKKWALWGVIFSFSIFLFFSSFFFLGAYCALNPIKCPIPLKYLQDDCQHNRLSHPCPIKG